MSFTASILGYNYGRYLGGAIDSALTKSLADEDTLEVLAIDDGSTDNMPEVCASHYGQIRVLRSANEDFGARLSKAVRHARGDHVCLLDADDHFAPGNLQSIRQALQAGASWVDHWQWNCDEAGVTEDGAHHGGNTSTICVHRPWPTKPVAEYRTPRFIVAFSGARAIAAFSGRSTAGIFGGADCEGHYSAGVPAGTGFLVAQPLSGLTGAVRPAVSQEPVSGSASVNSNKAGTNQRMNPLPTTGSDEAGTGTQPTPRLAPAPVWRRAWVRAPYRRPVTGRVAAAACDGLRP